MGVIGEIHRLGAAAWAPPATTCGSWVAVGSLADPAARGKAQLELYNVMGKVQVPRSATSLENDEQIESKGGMIFGSGEANIHEEFRIAGAQSAVPSLERIGGCALPSGIRQLAWGAAGRGACNLEGIIAIGLDDGTVQLWSAEALSARKAGAAEALLYGNPAHKRRHNGAVTALDFNPFVSTLLASGGPESAVFVWDLNDPNSPVVHATAANGADAGETAAGIQAAALLGAPSQVGCVQWNHRVQHILAAGLGNGNTVIWDLKQKRPVLSFSDPSARTRVSALAWNSEIATQIAVASDDDRNNTVKIWDLRNVHAPLRELHGHQRGVTALSWCPQDAGLLLSAGKDGRVICWNPSLTGSSADAEMLFELPISASWSFAVQWSPAVPGLFLTSDLGGVVTIWSTADRLMAGLSADQYPGRRGGLAPADRLLQESFGNAVFEGEVHAGSNKADDGYDVSQHARASVLSYAPKWMRPPCRGVFGFGAQLAYAVASDPCGLVLHLESPLSELEDIVHEAIRLVQPGYDLYQHCRQRAEQATSATDAQVWQVLAALSVPNSRLAVLEVICGAQSLPKDPQCLERNANTIGLLVSDPPVQTNRVAPVLTAAELEAAEVASEPNNEDAYASATPKAMQQPGSAATWMHQQASLPTEAWNAPAPWDRMPDAEGSSLLDAPHSALQERAHTSDASAETETVALKAPRSADEVGYGRASLREMLIQGELPRAIEACLRQGQMAEALMIAAAAGPVEWTKTLQETLQRSVIQNPTTRATLSSVVLGRLNEAVAMASASDWKDILALLLLQGTFADVAEGCRLLAERLTSNDDGAALICALCAADIAKATRLWMQQGYAGYPLLERMLIFRQILYLGNPTMDVGAVTLTAEALDVVEQMAALLVERGATQLADVFLSELGLVASELGDRIRQYLGSATGPRESASRQLGASSLSSWANANQPWPGGRATIPPPSTTTTHGNRGGASDHSNRFAGVGPGNATSSGWPASSSIPPMATGTASVPAAANGYAPPTPRLPSSLSTQNRLPVAGNVVATAPSMAAAEPRPVGGALAASPVAARGTPSMTGAIPALTSATATAANREQDAATASWTGPPSVPSTATGQLYPSGPKTIRTGPVSTMGPLSGPQTEVQGTNAGGSQLPRMTADGIGREVSILSVDIGSLPVMPKQVATTLQRIYAECAKRAVGGLERKKIQDIDRKLGMLLTRMKQGDVSADAIAKLHRLCSELEQHHLPEAHATHTELTREHYDGNSAWIMALKRLLEVAARVGY
jgi:protein transport protein SEC31